MFTNEKRQKERTGRYGTPRLQYLQELVTQFQNATNEETKERAVANLANFAYDPYNYSFLRQLNVLELFLDCITEPNEKLVEFGIGGVNSALGALYYLCNKSNRDEIIKPEVVDLINRYAAAEATSVSFSNLARAFLDKHVFESN
ncbi:uncharacterized protein LOC133830767 isoform X5 [Humulus lupulus]|uniref:uncharacterized protein LOC133830767 isoform X5 n=1 Tax=Humulus lupulus TaxID=3486 RepID=UPI002B40E403|nr:uncharacterized protein LOC133830767 isoform X5 [Humulus lupulus]